MKQKNFTRKNKKFPQLKRKEKFFVFCHLKNIFFHPGKQITRSSPDDRNNSPFCFSG